MLLRHPATAVTLGLAAVSWIVMIRLMDGMNMGAATPFGPFAFFVAAWASMIAAMMLPGAVPAVVRRLHEGGGAGAVQGDAHVAGQRAGDEQDVGMAGAGNEAQPEALQVMHDVAEGVELQLAAIAASGVHVADGQAAAEAALGSGLAGLGVGALAPARDGRPAPPGPGPGRGGRDHGRARPDLLAGARRPPVAARPVRVQLPRL